jgi:hypothetical protein
MMAMSLLQTMMMCSSCAVEFGLWLEGWKVEGGSGEAAETADGGL